MILTVFYEQCVLMWRRFRVKVELGERLLTELICSNVTVIEAETLQELLSDLGATEKKTRLIRGTSASNLSQRPRLQRMCT